MRFVKIIEFFFIQKGDFHKKYFSDYFCSCFSKFCEYVTLSENKIEFGFSKEKSEENLQNPKNR